MSYYLEDDEEYNQKKTPDNKSRPYDNQSADRDIPEQY